MNATEMLNTLDEKREALKIYQAEKEKLLDAAVPAEVRKKMDDIKAEFEPIITSASAEITQLEFDIKKHVYAYGETVKGDHLMAVFVKGRQTWDNKGLDIFAEIHPEILEFRKIGEPSVSIREVK